MYCRSVFVLLSLFAAVVTSLNTPACNDATTALIANQPCFNAATALRTAFSLNTTSGVDLNVYCVQSCRSLINRVAACGGEPRGMALNQFICTADSDGMNCYDFIFSARFAALQNDLRMVCSDVATGGQTCSSACQTAFQNFVIDGECCVVELLEFGSQIADMSFEESMRAQCPVDLSRGGTCTEIGGGATGLKAFGTALMFAIIIAVTVI